MGPTMRRVRPDDWELLRDLRLRALRSDPSSFGSTYEREAAFGDERWRAWVEEDAEGDDEVTLLACPDGEGAGMVAAYRDQKERTLFHVVAMWVAPEARGRGLGRSLLTEVEAWIAARGGTSVQLSVTTEASVARKLYEAAGYEPDGVVEASPHIPGVDHISLIKADVA